MGMASSWSVVHHNGGGEQTGRARGIMGHGRHRSRRARAALALPATTEKPSYGTPGFRVKDKLFARIREKATCSCCVSDVDEKDALIASEPDKFFTTPHYDGHAMVLVRFAAVDHDELAELLTESWRLRAPKRLLAEFDASLEP